MIAFWIENAVVKLLQSEYALTQKDKRIHLLDRPSPTSIDFKISLIST